MRRWLKRLFPVVMLAVLVQILAPIGVIQAAGAALDPFNNIPICSAHASSDTQAPDEGAPSHGMCCPLCALSQGVAMPPVDPAMSIVAPFSWRPLVWTGSCERTLAYQIFGPAQARAPPHLS